MCRFFGWGVWERIRETVCLFNPSFSGHFPVLHSEVVENASPLFGSSVASHQHGSYLGNLHEVEAQVSIFGLLWSSETYFFDTFKPCSTLLKSLFRLNDDWAFANETRCKQWDFQEEERELKAAIERFNLRRYGHLYPDQAFQMDVKGRS